MELEFNKKLVKYVLSHIDKKKKPVNFLVKTLNISFESAYRRLRGKIPFTIQELIILADELDFSIDKIFYIIKQNKTIFDYAGLEKINSDYFLIKLNEYNEFMIQLSYAKKIDSIMVLNFFPPPFFAEYKSLNKLLYYKLLYQEKETTKNVLFSEFVLADEDYVFQEKKQENIIHGNHITLILDLNIFYNLIKEVEYFFRLELLTKKDLILLKEDILNLINQFETISQTGIFNLTKVQLYLSLLSVGANAIFYNYDDKMKSLFWEFTYHPVVFNNPGFISTHLKWLNSLKRQSELITQSNEIMQTEFFYQQRKNVEKYLSV